MSLFGTRTQSTKYHAELTTGDRPVQGQEAVNRASDEQLQEWASDPDCIEQEQSACTSKLAAGRTGQTKRKNGSQAAGVTG
jgi:hypothetical protein